MNAPNNEDAVRLKRALVAMQNMRAKLEALEFAQREPIAIIGIGCRFPGANSPAAFWQLLQSGGDTIQAIPPERWMIDAYYDPTPGTTGKMYTRNGSFLDQVDTFDARFFGIGQREAISLDPQHRLLLEVGWEALEHAALNPQQLMDSQTGVFIGISGTDYLLRLQEEMATALDGYVGSGNQHSVASGRLSYLLGLHGPNLAVDTACSSSLVAIHLAVTSLRQGECNLALAGGVNLLLSPGGFIGQCQAKMLSADGYCKTFAATADGYGRGEGCGIVVLKRLSDAQADHDSILAVIRGSAVQQDGHTSGLTAPNGLAQQAVIRQALKNGHVEPSEVSYVEAHGSGTPLGDPIEVNALGAVFGGRTEPLLIGTVKTNIGHLEAAAGIAGLIKGVLALHYGEIPPHLHFHEPNPHIDWAQLPIRVPTQNTPWPQQKRLAGVSSFGFSGTIAHVVLEAAPAPSATQPQALDEQTVTRPIHLLTLSAQNEQALLDLAARYEATLSTPLALGDICFTTNTGRAHFRHRLAVIATTATEAAEKLVAFRAGQMSKGVTKGRAQRGHNPKIAFLFTGQGAQYVAMGCQLYATLPIFRQALERCDKILRPVMDTPLLDILYPALSGAEKTDVTSAKINQTAYTQPAIFALAYALAEVWKAWGIEPDVVMGHSAGEYAAAYVAGILSLEDGLKLSAARGRLMATTSTDCATAAVFASAERVAEAIAPYAQTVSLAGINSAKETLIAGVANDVKTILATLSEAKIGSRPVRVSHASHSPLMEPVLDEFEQMARTATYHAPRVKFISNVTGELIERVDAAYWRRHMREPVHFAQGMQRIAEIGCDVMLEIGPQPALLWLGRQNWTGSHEVSWLSSLWAIRSDWEQMLQSVSELYVRGADLDWRSFHRDYVYHKVVLPTYPFQRQRYWINQGTEPLLDRMISTSLSTVKPLQEDTPPRIKEVELPVMNSNEQEILPAMNHQNGSTKPIPPQTLLPELRAALATLFELEPASIEADVTFVELGADSLLLGKVTQAVEQKYGVPIGIHQLFDELDSLGALVTYLEQQLPSNWAASSSGAPTAPIPQPDKHAGEQSLLMPSTRPATAADIPPLPSDASALERIMAQQLQTLSQVIAQQLALLGSNGHHAPPLSAQNGASPLPAQPSALLASKALDVSTTAPAHQPIAKPAAPHAPAMTTKKLSEQQQQYVDTLIARYTQRTAASKQHAQQHRAQIADARSTAGFRLELKELNYMIVGERANGARFWDIDHNEYVDIAMGVGALLCGHSAPFISVAVEAQMKKSIEIGPDSTLAGEVANLCCALTGHERVMFSTSGTEAMMGALRLARAATGRSKIVMFMGAYHGQSDGTLALPNPEGDKLQTIPMAPGVSQQAVTDVLVLPYDDAKSLEIIKAHAHELAAVVVEPVQSRRPDWQPKAFLHALRQLTQDTGVALIFDEVITGFRIHPGGSQAWFGVQADLATYGKIVGGGMPVSIVAGKATYLNYADGGPWRYGDSSYPQVEKSFVGGTFRKHPLGMAAARALLQHLKDEGPGLQERLNQRTQQFAATVNAFFENEQVPIRVTHFGSLFRFVWKGNVSYVYQPLEMDLFHYQLLEKGIYTWEGRTCFLSTAHTDADIAQIIRAVEESIVAMKKGGFLPQSTSRPRLNNSQTPAAAEALQIPLSEEQRALWQVTQNDDKTAPDWRNSVNLLLQGPLQRDMLQRALQTIVNRHEALRTTISRTGDFQTVQPVLPLTMAEVDLTHLHGARQDEAIAAWFTQELATPFVLDEGPLIRACLLKLQDERHLLALATHHIISDGWSIGIMLEELAALYSAECQATVVPLEPPHQYREFIQWQAQQSQTEPIRAQAADWLTRFEKGFPVAKLPTDHPRSAQKSLQGKRYSARLNADLSNQIKGMGRAHGATLFMTLLAGYTLLLHQLTGQDDLIVGTPIAGRTLEKSKRLVGYCPHFLPIYSHLDKNLTVAETIACLKKTVLLAFKHQEVPFARLFEQLKTAKELGAFPGMTTLFNLDQAIQPPQLFGLQVQPFPAPANFALVDFRLDAIEIAGELWLDYDYSAARFEPETIGQWHGAFQHILEGMVANPRQSIGDLLKRAEAV